MTLTHLVILLAAATGSFWGAFFAYWFVTRSPRTLPPGWAKRKSPDYARIQALERSLGLAHTTQEGPALEMRPTWEPCAHSRHTFCVAQERRDVIYYECLTCHLRYAFAQQARQPHLASLWLLGGPWSFTVSEAMQRPIALEAIPYLHGWKICGHSPDEHLWEQYVWA